MRRLIAELGLRYRPNERSDLEAHAARLALLADDVADIPPRYLERAINDWVLKSPYLPKASDLAQIAKSYVSRPDTVERVNPIDKRRAMLASMNAKLAADRAVRPEDYTGDFVWDIDSGGSFYLRDL